jgi:CRP-like cAMP-binding protein
MSNGVGDHPGFARAFASHLAYNVQRARAHAEILSMKRVAERVDAWVALNDGVLPPKGGWHHVAAEINVSPEAMYRELARQR